MVSPSTISGWLAVNLTVGQQIPVAQQSFNLRSPTPACLLTATTTAAADALLELCDDLLRYSTSQTLSPKPSSSGMDCGLYHCQSIFLIGNKSKLQGARKKPVTAELCTPYSLPTLSKAGPLLALSFIGVWKRWKVQPRRPKTCSLRLCLHTKVAPT